MEKSIPNYIKAPSVSKIFKKSLKIFKIGKRLNVFNFVFNFSNHLIFLNLAMILYFLS